MNHKVYHPRVSNGLTKILISLEPTNMHRITKVCVALGSVGTFSQETGTNQGPILRKAIPAEHEDCKRLDCSRGVHLVTW